MRSPRPLTAVLVVALVGSGVSLGFVGVAAAQPDLAVTAVEITPADPAPGERVTVTATIENLPSSDETVQVTSLYVRDRGAPGVGELVRFEDVGSIGVGGSITVPLSMSFESPGDKDLRLHVVVQDSDGFHRIAYPAQVSVSPMDDVNMAIASADPVAGETTAVNVTVANGGDTPISNVQLELGGEGAVDNPRRVSGTIPAQTDQAYAYAVRFDEAGPGTLDAALTYTVNGGVTRTTTEAVEVSVDPAAATTEGRIQLTRVESIGGTTLTISGEAANVGTTDAQSVFLRVQESETVTPLPPSGDYFVGTVEGSEFGTFELTAEVDPATDVVPVVVEWTVDDERRSEVVQVDVAAGQSSIGSQPGLEGGDGPNGAPSGGGPLGGLPVGLLGIVIVIIGIPSLGYYLWNRR